MISDRNVRDLVSDSQNFTLRVSLSEDSIIEDTQDLVVDNKKKDDVIVISDSSCSSYENLEKWDWKLTSASKNKNKTKYQKLHILESSSSENEGEKLDRQWRRLGRFDDKSLDRKYVNKNTTQVPNTFYASDGTTINSRHASCDGVNDRVEKSNIQKSYESPRITFEKQKTKECNTNVNKAHEMYNINQMQKVITPNRGISSDGSSVVGKFNKFFVCNTPQQKSVGKTKLTKEDTHKILRNIKSTQVVYNSPREKRETNVIISESTDEDENVMHPAISPRDNREINYCNDISDVIETSLKDDIVPDSQTNSSAAYRKHIDKFLKTSRQEKFHRSLPDRKRKQIAEWLLTNQSDSQSDSFCSNIPASIRNSMGSGNSSLERLELVYETPNNRGKVNKMDTGEKQTTNINRDAATRLSSTQQTTLDNFFKISINNSVFRMPDASKSLPKVHVDNKTSSSSVVNASENMDVKKCADILDKLYGETWRDKADILLPTSEPRNKCIQKTDRLIQTERKLELRNKYRATDSDNSVGQNIKTNPGRRINRKHKKRLDSFINDGSLSSDDNESIYLTALTNPRISRKNGHNNVPSEHKHRKPPSFEICDMGTEDELDDISSTNSKKSLRRKRLSFSDDESSNTSEFDPGDYVPPKYISRKEATKTPQPPKVIRETTNRTIGHKSFLASLSDKVPITSVHLNAKKYRIDYKNKKEELCKELYKLYNERVFDNKLPLNMPIEWNVRMRGTAGFCYNKKSTKSLTGIVRSSRIVLATKILDAPDRLRDTLIHEMCHAASWLINDVLDGHGPFWTAWANKAMKAFPELPPIRRCHDYEIKTKFTYRCTGCGYSIGRHSKSLNIEQKRCGHCYGKFELLINKTTKSGVVQMQTPKREPSGFALYVKQNYNSVKKEKSNIKHAEVMKILGQQFSAIKIAKRNDLAMENDTETPG